MSVIVPAPLFSQIGIEPNLGLYIPVGAIIEEPTPAPRGLLMRQVGVGFAGIRGTGWISRWLAVEGNFAYSPSYVAVTDSTGTHDHGAAVVFADGRVLAAFTAARTAYAGVGLGVVSRSGGVWMGRDGTTLPAAVACLGIRTPIRHRMAMRLEVEDYITRTRFDETQPAQGQQRAHHDLLWSVGVMIPLKGRQ
jgi:hypothetical protein